MSPGVAGSWQPLVEAAAGRLLEASLWGAGLALGVWALCALVPDLPAAWRRWLWWGVALKLLLGLVPLPQVALPVLAPPPAAAAARPAALAPSGALAPEPTGGREAAVLAPRAKGSPPRLAERLLAALVGAWALGAALALVGAALEAWRAARLVRRALEPSDPRLRERFAHLARELGTPRARLRVSRDVETPQLTGILRPTVLLPDGATAALAGPELDMAIAHELVHVRQHDLALGLVPALASRLFFFHPAARLAAREHALAREAVCDAAVVGRFAPSPRDYGRLLLRLSLPGRAPLRAAVAAASHHTLHRRLDMLLHPPRRTRAAWGWIAGAAAIALLIPFRLTASESGAERPRAAEPSAQAAPQAPAAPAVAAAAEVAPAPAVPADAPVRVAMAHPAESAIEGAAETEEAYEAYEEHETDEDREDQDLEVEEGEGWEELEAEAEEWEDWNRGRAFMLTHGEGNILSGSRRDHERAAAWRRGDEEVLWFRRDDHEWVIRDPAILARARKLWEPQHELGRRQAELGEGQAELGTEQAELGRRQAELGAEQAELAAQQAELGARMAEVDARAAALAAREYRAGEEERRQLREKRRQIDAEREPLEERASELGRAMGELGRRQGELGRAQGELGRRQGQLGARQGVLGREQGRLGRIAEREVWKILDEAVASGSAERVR